jgi:peroxiredoxin
MTAFRTHTDRFVEANAQVLGVSIDTPPAAGEFEAQLGLEFPLLSDFPRNQVGRDFGVYNENVSSTPGQRSSSTRMASCGIYPESRDFESHATHALEVLATLNG